jgi:hypothetical protein
VHETYSVLKMDEKVVTRKYICKDCNNLECPDWPTMDLHCRTVHGAIELTDKARARLMLGRTKYDPKDESMTKEEGQKPFQGPDGGLPVCPSRKLPEKLRALEPPVYL